jgi:hypothetical protein
VCVSVGWPNYRYTLEWIILSASNFDVTTRNRTIYIYIYIFPVVPPSHRTHFILRGAVCSVRT